MDQDPGKSTESVVSPVNIVDDVNIEVSSGPAQQGPNPPINKASRSLERRRIILEAQSPGSVRDVVEETETEAPSLTKYEAYNYPTKFKAQCDIDELASKYCIPTDQFICYLPTNADRTCNASKDLCVFKETLDARVRFPLHPFITELLRSFSIHPSQI